MTDLEQLENLLYGRIDSPWDRLYRMAIRRLVVQYQQWQGRDLVYDEDASRDTNIKYIFFLLHEISAGVHKIERYQNEYAAFHRSYTQASNTAEQNSHILDFCKILGASQKQLQADKKALRRWFDVDAVTERSLRLQHDEEVQLAFVTSRLSVFMDALVAEGDQVERLKSWQRFQFDKVLMPLLLYKGDERVRVAAFKALSQLMLPLSSTSMQVLPADTVRYIYRFAMDKSQPIWNQVEALHLLSNINPQELATIFAGRLYQVDEHDREDLFFRHYAVLEIAQQHSAYPPLLDYVPSLLADPNPYVRQAFAQVLSVLPYDTGLEVLCKLLQDECSPVRAAMLLQIPNLIEAHQRVEPFFGLLLGQLDIEQDDFVIRVGLHIVCASYQQVIALSSSRAQNIQQPLTQLETLLTRLHTEADSTKVRRWAAQTREQLWASVYQGHSQRDEERQASLTALFDLEPGQSQRLNKAQRAAIKDSSAKRWLATKTADDFGFDIGRKHFTRDSKTGFRLWRFLFEWRNPATDKRQNYNHQKGRLYSGLDYIPAQNLAEVSATKVPGEPLHIGEEGDWRPYLPLVDQVISSLDQNWPTQPLKIYSSEGITYLKPPTGFFKRLYARTQLTLRFTDYAKLRNWSSEDKHGPEAYAQALAKLGFTLSITSHLDSQGKPYPKDSKVAHFFPAIVPVFLLPWWSEFQAYFFSVYQNTITQLTWFLVAMLSLFLGMHVYANNQFRRARNDIPLVIGGWGTRGKSGTERLKAALFNGLGLSILSKTTGCEAMFVYAGKNRPLFEMFLFRPYDKATIWEQVNVTRIAKDLNTDVLLWECMGLTPRYIEILQQQWMQDDIATIVNCYPDHEDLQGPAGVDIPKVMMNFVPKNSVLLTTEENMLPYLKLAAKKNNCQIITVNWLDAGLLTPDILARFPYDEHPNNIALVLELGRHMGIEDAYTLKEMADRVVPDLGVLKTFPVAPMQGRRLQFINGMSANERFGALGNWNRLELDKKTLSQSPESWIVTVVNNREDRVARSQVFANFLVRDISADRHLLIGSNLSGLMGFIEKTWQVFMEEQGMVSGTDKSTMRTNLLSLAVHLRVPQHKDEVEARLEQMCKGLGVAVPAERPLSSDMLLKEESGFDSVEQAEAMVSQYKYDCEQQEILEGLLSELDGQGGNGSLSKIQDQLWQWFKVKLVVVDDYYITGNQLVQKLCQQCAPGLLSSVMGLQNIKGTGLDFVYRWQAWEKNYELCQQLQNEDEDLARTALRDLAQVQSFGALDNETVLQSLKQAQASHFSQTELCQAQIVATEAQLAQQLETVTSAKQENKIVKWFGPMLDHLESFIDVGDAVKRRRKSNRIIKDLVNLRISQGKAARELSLITQKQKGGWLKKALLR